MIVPLPQNSGVKALRESKSQEEGTLNKLKRSLRKKGFQELTQVVGEYLQMKTAELKDKTKQGMTFKSKVPSEKRDMNDSLPVSDEKTLCDDATGNPVIASIVRTTRKNAAASNVTTTNSSSDTVSSDSDDTPKSWLTRTPLLSSEHASKTPSVTVLRIPLGTKPPAKELYADDTSDESSRNCDVQKATISKKRITESKHAGRREKLLQRLMKGKLRISLMLLAILQLQMEGGIHKEESTQFQDIHVYVE